MDDVELRARIRAMARNPETFARRAGLPVETVRQVFDGEIRPSPQLRLRLAKALGVEEQE